MIYQKYILIWKYSPKQKKFEDAIINYKNAIKLNPKFVELIIIEIFSKKEKFEDAIINYKMQCS